MAKKTKKLNDEYLLTENTLKKIFEVLPVGLWFVDKDGTLLKGNPEGKKIWGAEPKVNPKNYGVFKARYANTGKEIKPEDWALYKTIKHKKTIKNEILEIDAFDGKTKIISNSTAPILTDNKEILGAIVVNKEITEEEQLKKELSDLKQFLEDVLNGIPYPVYVKNKNNEFLYVNDSFCMLTKCSRKKIIGKKRLSCISKKNANILLKRNEELLLNGDECEDELDITINNKRHVLSIKRKLFKNIDETILVGLIKDITEKKLRDLKLKESEEKYKNIFNNSPEGIALVNSKGKIIHANQRLYDWLGYDENYFEGKNIFSIPILSFKNKKKILSDILFNKFKNKKYRLEILKKDGSPIFIEVTKGVKNSDSDTKLIFVRNLDENIKLKDEIHNLSNKFTSMVEKSSESILITDNKGLIEYVNPYFEKITGYKKSEVIGKSTKFLSSGKHSEDFFEELWETLNSGKVWKGQIINKKKSGEEFTEDMTITPIKDDYGKIINFIALKYDITHLKEYENELQNHIEELEQFRDATVDRELKMVELEKENKELKKRLKL